jgi:serine phosphatase RsbU (regulator of sigma subunit)
MYRRNRLTVGTLSVASFGRPCPGERVSGDAAFMEERDGRVCLGMLDGLGHGPAAHQVVQRALELLRLRWSPDPAATLRMLNEALRGSLGMAAGLGALDVASGEFAYAGVGNTVCVKLGADTQRLFSAEGIVGSHMRPPVRRSLHLGRDEVLLLYTDGLRERIDARQYPQLWAHGTPAIARNLVVRFGKDHDDATCMAARYER